MCSCGPPHMANQKQDDQLEHSYSSYVMIRDVTLKTCRRRWMIGRRGERGSGISVLAARHDDDDDGFIMRSHPLFSLVRVYSNMLYLHWSLIFDTFLSLCVYKYVWVCVCLCSFRFHLRLFFLCVCECVSWDYVCVCVCARVVVWFEIYR